MPISTPTPPLANRRHDLGTEVVAQAVARKVERLEADCLRQVEHAECLQAKYAKDVAAGVAQRNWTREPWSPESVRQFYEKDVQCERSYYAKVRVIELPQEGRRFILVYGDADDATVNHGTGPFETLEEAAAWFFGGGR